MNKKIIWTVVVVLIVLGSVVFGFYYTSKLPDKDATQNGVASSTKKIVYENNNYGFTFSLPSNWQGYTVVETKWEGNALTSAIAPTGPKLIIRNPKWTEAAHYEDIPILVFTISEWDSYLAEKFSVSAAPILASELARNNKYVFALPPRWNFDFSLGFEEAQNIIAGKPLYAFDF